MARQKPIFKMLSHGIYHGWDAKSKDLPKIKQFTTDIPAEIDIEFGFIINIKKARGKKIFYCIDHPGIHDKEGNKREAFTGEVHVTNNDWDFYLGDTIWAPISDKCGPWNIYIELDNTIIAQKTFNLSNPSDKEDETDFWKNLGF
ncbi:DUF3859 domain-containing protein [Psychromonas sp. KJ10-10]|uniref:DUF3859 domain-containing protein n=1 Tax=Psychromonas sp. KJ10-10 TaxID=3391823 RepID=UPI0039B6AC0F